MLKKWLQWLHKHCVRREPGVEFCNQNEKKVVTKVVTGSKSWLRFGYKVVTKWLQDFETKKKFMLINKNIVVTKWLQAKLLKFECGFSIFLHFVTRKSIRGL